MKLRYLHLDVFTSTPFEGNQLAVFPDPGGLTTDQMQTITREMNFSECTFIFPREGDGDVRMRIFTPGEELPMAGHPTIGSTFALALEGTIARGRTDWVFELGVGPTPVSLEWKDGQLQFAWMTQRNPEFGATIADRAALAAACGVTAADLLEFAPVQVVSCGVPFLYVPLKTRQAVDAVSIDRRAHERCCRTAGLKEMPTFFFTMDAGTEVPAHGTTIYSRMLAPGLGVSEDPATGSAAGPVGCYMLHYKMVSAEQARAIVNVQGVQMLRPSRIHVSIDSTAGAITRVRVGGQSVLVGRGVIETGLGY